MSIQNQSLVEILCSTVEAWRNTAVAIAIVASHVAFAAGAATEINFDFGGSDAYDRAKKSAQKIFRWLDEGDLPANMIPSILAALPSEQRLTAMNQIPCPLGIEARAADQAPAIGFDPLKHLKNIAKESAKEKLALIQVGAEASEEQLLQVRVELTEASVAYQAAADDVTAEIQARWALARASA